MMQIIETYFLVKINIIAFEKELKLFLTTIFGGVIVKNLRLGQNPEKIKNFVKKKHQGPRTLKMEKIKTWKGAY